VKLAKSRSLSPPILEQSQGLWQRMVDAGMGVRMSLRPWSNRSFLITATYRSPGAGSARANDRSARLCVYLREAGRDRIRWLDRPQVRPRGGHNRRIFLAGRLDLTVRSKACARCPISPAAAGSNFQFPWPTTAGSVWQSKTAQTRPCPVSPPSKDNPGCRSSASNQPLRASGLSPFRSLQAYDRPADQV